MLLLRYEYLITYTNYRWLVISRRLKFGINALHAHYKLMTLFFQSLSETKLASIQPFAIRTVYGFGRWRSFFWCLWYS